MILRSLILSLCLLSDMTYADACSPLLDIDVRTLNEKRSLNLCKEYQGKVILIVNTASRCAYTDQYDDLEALYKKYRQQGLVILGFPSNDFGQQEPGSEAEIKAFCRLTYGVEFPMFEKTQVAQRHAGVLYQNLARVSGRYPQWNFHKYLIDREGNYHADFPSAISPMATELTSRILELLKSE